MKTHRGSGGRAPSGGMGAAPRSLQRYNDNKKIPPLNIYEGGKLITMGNLIPQEAESLNELPWFRVLMR